MFDEWIFAHLYERIKRLSGADGALIATAILMNTEAIMHLIECLEAMKDETKVH